MGINPIKHHTVPCSYLRRFSKDPYVGKNGRGSLLYLYDRSNSKGWYAKVNSILWENDFYTYEGLDGIKKYKIEEFLATNVDNIGKILEKIDNCLILSDEELVNLAKFIVFQDVRSSPRKQRNHQNDVRFFNQILSIIYSHEKTIEGRKIAIQNSLKEYFPNAISELSTEEIMSKYEKSENIVINNDFQNFMDEFLLAFDLAYRLLHRDRIILQIPENYYFIGADFPTFLGGSIGYGNADTVNFPLTKKSYLSMKYNGGELSGVKNVYEYLEKVDLINLLNVQAFLASKRFLVGSNEDVIQNLLRMQKS